MKIYSKIFRKDFIPSISAIAHAPPIILKVLADLLFFCLHAVSFFFMVFLPNQVQRSIYRAAVNIKTLDFQHLLCI